MTTVIIWLVVFIGIAGLAMLIMQPVLANYAYNYMMRVRHTSRVMQQPNSRQSNSKIANICKLLGQMALRIFPVLNNVGMRQVLIEAHFRNADHMAILTGARILCAGPIVLLVASQGTLSSLIMSAVAGFSGWILPNFIVKGRANKRKEQLFLELPAFIDLIAVCAKAGLGLLAALDRVYKEIGMTCPIIQQELEQLITDVKVFARPLRTALQDMSDRCGVEELSNFTAALIIADQKGADISSTLQKQSGALRDRIKRKVEERLNTAPIKMVPITLVFVLPLLFVPALGGPVMQVINLLSAFQHTR